VNDLYDGKKSEGLENGAKKLDEKKIDDHYDTEKTDASTQAAAATEAPKAAGGPPAEIAGTQAAVQVDKKAKFVGDLYDGKHSDGLENGAKKHDYSTYTNDHYDDLNAKHKDAPAVAAKTETDTKSAAKPQKAAADAKPEAKAEGVPAELAGSLAEVKHKKKHHKKHHHSKKHNKEYAQADEQINE
jgi:hypothetical protein